MKSATRWLAIAVIVAVAAFAQAAKPGLQLFELTPSDGQIGASVEITGTGFSATPELNAVVFPGKGNTTVQAKVHSASPNKLIVTVPADSVTGPVYVRMGALTSNRLNFLLRPTISVSAGPNQAITLPAGATLHGSAFSDSNSGGKFVASWSQLSGPGLVAFSNPSSYDTVATFSLAGIYVLRLSVSNNVQAGSSDVTITAAPTFNVSAGPSQNVRLPGTITLSGTASGFPASPGFSVLWQQVSGPGVAAFSNPTSATTNVDLPIAGTYVFRLTAIDGSFTSSSDVSVIASPSITASAGPNQQIQLPSLATLTGEISEVPQAPTFSASWSKVSGPGDVAFSNPSSPVTSASFSAWGTYVLRLTASDGAYSTSSDTTITAIPTITAAAGANQDVKLPATVSLGGVVNEIPASSALSASWSKVSGPGDVTFGNPSSASTTASFSAWGTYVLRLTATDGPHSSSSDTTITAAPTLAVSAGPDQNVKLPAGVNLSGTVTETPAGPGLSVLWSKASGPGDVTFGNPSSAGTTANFSASGIYVLRLTATDGPHSASSDLTVAATPTITVNAGPDQNVKLPAAATLAGTAIETPTGSGFTVLWTKVSGPGDVIFASATSANTSANFSAWGTYVLRLSGSDGPFSVTSDVTVTATPTITASAGANQNVVLPASALLAGSASETPLSAGFTTSWSKVSGPGNVVFANAAALSTTADFSAWGTYVLRLTATDGPFSVTSDLTVTAVPTMTANAGANQNVKLPATAALAGTASENPLSPGFSTAWSKVSGPGDVAFASAASPDTTATFSAWGTYVLRLTATDGPFTATSDVTIVTTPTITAAAGSSQNVKLPAAANLSGTASETPQGSGFATSWSKVSGPGDVSFANAASLSTTANFSAWGTYVLRLTATDGPFSATSEVTIVTAPTITAAAGVNQNVQLPAAATLAGTASETPQGTGFSTQWSKVSGPGAVTFANAASLSTTANFSAWGTYVLRLTAADGPFSEISDITITTTPTITASAGANQNVKLPASATLAGTATETPASAGFSSVWSQVSGPGTVTFANPDSPATTASFSAWGTYVLRLKATDGPFSATSDVTIVTTPTITASAGSNQNVKLPATATLSGTASETPATAEFSKLWSKVSGPGDVTFADASSLGTTASFSAWGTYVLRLTASDGPFSATSDVTITTAPTITAAAGANQNLKLPAEATLSGAATSTPASSAFATAWSKMSGPGTVTFASPSSLNTTASFSAWGTYVLRLTATDGPYSETSDLTVTATPTITSSAGSNQNVKLPAESTLSGTATSTPASAAFATSWSKLSGPGTVTFANSASLTTTATFSAWGTYILRLTATDGPYSETSDLTVTTTPTITSNAGADQNIKLPANATLAGIAASTPASAAFATSWSKVSGPGDVTFSDVSSVNSTAAFSIYGTYVLRLTSTDGPFNATSDITVTVAPALTVNAGTPQIVKLPALLTLPGTVVGLSATGTILWTKVSGPGDVTFGNPAVPGTTANFSAWGTYVLRLTATDPPLLATSDLTVTATPTVTVVAGPNQNVKLPGLISLAGSATVFPDSQSFSVLWTKVSGPGDVKFGNAEDAQSTAELFQAGTYVVRLTGTEGPYSVSSDLTITAAPTITVNAGKDQTVRLPALATLAGSADEVPHNPAFGTTWSKVSGPGDVTFSDPASVTANANFSAPGHYTLRLTGTHGPFYASSDVRITVNPVSIGVDTGPPKTLALPARDLTLFTHVSGVDDTSYTVAWKQTSGPADVAFSAPWALTTTASFTMAGVYGIDVTVSEGTATTIASTTVAVLSAESQTSFYVDPTYTGLVSDGSADHPWKSFATDRPTDQWTAVNNALATNNVIVYFSARQAISDTAEIEHHEVNLWRTDKGTNRLTLDGMSKYNTNDDAPLWADYTGTNKFNINITVGGLSIGVQSPFTDFPNNYTTIRGFDVSGTTGRVALAGNSTVVEYMRVHDLLNTGPSVIFHQAVDVNCRAVFGNLHDITLRNNVVERGFGEAIYISGNYLGEGGCLQWGNTHSDILIENNLLDQSAANGGETDQIDLKAGLRNVTIRGNVLKGGNQFSSGIVSLGVIPGLDNVPLDRTDYVIENNQIINRNGYALSQLLNQNGTVIRNNILANNGSGIGIAGDEGDKFPFTYNNDVQIYNNTLYGNGIGVAHSKKVIVRNNLLAAVPFGTYELVDFDSTVVDSDYNILVDSTLISNGWNEGPHSQSLPSNADLFVDPANGNFQLKANNPAIQNGVDLHATGFDVDFSGKKRPKGSAWDIGAFQFVQ